MAPAIFIVLPAWLVISPTPLPSLKICTLLNRALPDIVVFFLLKITVLVPGSLPDEFWSSQPPLKTFCIVRVLPPMVKIPPFSILMVLMVVFPVGSTGSKAGVSVLGIIT